MEQLNNVKELELTEEELKDLLGEEEYPRTFVINEDFTEELEDRFMEWFLNLPDCYDEDAEPIRLHISSNGGSVTTLFKMIDMLDRFRGKIYGYANGVCASAGLFLLCACDRRAVGNMCDLLYHTSQYTVSEQGNIADHKQIAKDVKKVNDKIEKFMVNRVGIDEKWLRKHRYEDYWLDKTEAIELGIHNAEEYDELN